MPCHRNATRTKLACDLRGRQGVVIGHNGDDFLFGEFSYFVLSGDQRGYGFFRGGQIDVLRRLKVDRIEEQAVQSAFEIADAGREAGSQKLYHVLIEIAHIEVVRLNFRTEDCLRSL